MIDFELDEGQQELAAGARGLFEQAGGIALARELLEQGGGWSPDLWARMAALDWAGLLVPEAHGGSGGGVLDLYAISVETGRALVTSPLIPSSVIAAHVLAAGGTAAQQTDLLPRIASGDAIVIPAVLEPSGAWDEGGIETTLDRGPDTLRLSGTKVLVPFAADATRLLVAAREDDGTTLVLVDPSAPGVTVSPVDNVAGLPLATVVLDGVVAAPADVVGTPTEGWSLLGPAFARGAVLRAAEIAGAGQRMLDLSVDYAKERVQFGTPVGKHQAVQYLCTDIAMESHLTALLARRAAWLLDVGQPSDRAVAAAKLYASRAAHHMAQQAHEVFAGLAFMMEHDLHLFTRHAKHWEHDLGDVRHHAEALVQAVEAGIP